MISNEWMKGEIVYNLKETNLMLFFSSFRSCLKLTSDPFNDLKEYLNKCIALKATKIHSIKWDTQKTKGTKTASHQKWFSCQIFCRFNIESEVKIMKYNCNNYISLLRKCPLHRPESRSASLNNVMLLFRTFFSVFFFCFFRNHMNHFHRK